MRVKKGSPVPVAGLRVPESELMALSAVNMAPYNPRFMPPAMMRSLKASLVKHGMVLNLVAQRQSDAYGKMVMIGGHQRVTAMRELCAERSWTEPTRLPVVILDVGDAEAKQLNVALNNIEGEFDPARLGAMFADIAPKMTADDVLATGFLRENIDELVRLVLPPEEEARLLEESIGELAGFASSITLSIEFSTVAARDEAKELVRSMTEDKKRKAGDLMLDVLKSSALANRGRRRS